MNVPKYFEMNKPFLEAIKDGLPHTIKEIKPYIVNYFHLTEADLSELLPSGRQTYFANRLGWARFYLKKAGLIEVPSRGTFIITPSGKEALSDNPNVIDVEYLMKFPCFANFINAEKTDKPTTASEADAEDTPDDILEKAYKEITRNLVDDLLAEVMKISPVAFERLVLKLLEEIGYGAFESSATTTPVTGDEGIDGIVNEDKLGFDKIFIQAKRWNAEHVVGRPEVQAFVGAIAGRGGKGLFVTTSKFTKGALEYAANQHIILMDGEKLSKHMIEHNFGVTVKKVFAIKAIDNDLFEEYGD